MANTFNLGGSPLGLIGVLSRPSRDGMSTFNGGKSRNVNVSKYNNGSKQGESGKERRVSLFSGGSIPSFWANIGVAGTDQDETGTKNKDSYKGINRNTLHNNDVYDTSILNIIEKLSSSNRAALRPLDFAYLKFLGVYPNNRLMIARKFSTPMKDNIMTKGGSAPLAVLISWKPETEENFLDFTFGEEWEDAAADFTDVLNKIGGDFGIGGSGGGLSKALNVIPLQGFTETIQRKVLTKLGILEDIKEDPNGVPIQTDTPLPSGNPNIIKMAKRRKTFGYSEKGSGLKCTISIKMACEYEQKFISGIDPTIAWMDIINNVLSFGTSISNTYGLSENFSKKLDEYSKDVNKLIGDVVDGLADAFRDLSDKIEIAINSLSGQDSDAAKKAREDAELEKNKDGLSKFKNLIDDTTGLLKKTLKETVSKYRIEIMGIAHNLSGMPSTPWHITIGNPLRPIFCSGDMLVDEVTLKLGSNLAFNDLPSTIKVEFTLKNARPLGLQEIMSKFNTGYLRTVNTRRDFMVSSGAGDVLYEDGGAKIEQESSGSSTGSVNNQQQAATPIVNKENAQQNSQNRTV
jgi:hypothetical protein